MKSTLLALLPMLLVATDCRADNCEAIRAHIESRFRAGGMADVVLAVVDAAPVSSGRIVGTCANGARQIVVTGAGAGAGVGVGVTASAPSPSPSAPDRAAVAPDRASAAQASAARPRAGPASGAEPAADRIPTECKDGSIVLGPDCGDPRAARLTKDQLIELTSGTR